MFFGRTDFTSILTVPATRLENREVKIPKPILEHHHQRTGEGPNQINLVQTQTCRLVFYSYLGEWLSPFNISYCIVYIRDCAHHVHLSFLLKERLSTKDSLGRAHSGIDGGTHHSHHIIARHFGQHGTGNEAGGRPITVLW